MKYKDSAYLHILERFGIDQSETSFPQGTGFLEQHLEAHKAKTESTTKEC